MAITASERAKRAGPSTREAQLCCAGLDGLRGEPARGETPSRPAPPSRLQEELAKRDTPSRAR